MPSAGLNALLTAKHAVSRASALALTASDRQALLALALRPREGALCETALHLLWMAEPSAAAPLLEAVLDQRDEARDEGLQILAVELLAREARQGLEDRLLRLLTTARSVALRARCPWSRGSVAPPQPARSTRFRLPTLQRFAEPHCSRPGCCDCVRGTILALSTSRYAAVRQTARLAA